MSCCYAKDVPLHPEDRLCTPHCRYDQDTSHLPSIYKTVFLVTKDENVGAKDGDVRAAHSFLQHTEILVYACATPIIC